MYTKPALNAGVNVLAPQNPPTFRIAPVSSQLINAARRARDPRLRKIEQESKPINSNASDTKEIKTVAASIPIDTKNDQRNGLYIILLRVKLITNVISVRNIYCAF